MNLESGCLPVSLFFCLLVAALIFGGDVLESRLRYQLQYDAERETVTVHRRPVDCDFWGAPIGRKSCNYEKNVSTVRFALDVGGSRPVISFDDGKSWHWNDGGPIRGAGVEVTWLRFDQK